jgi:hypothetical protein
LTRYRTRSAIIAELIHQKNSVIEQFETRPCVALAIDAGTIGLPHFLDIMILAPDSNLRPFLYDARDVLLSL